MEQPQIQLQPQTNLGLSDSASRLGASLAEQQVAITQEAYQQRYNEGITSLWESQIYASECTGEELAALRLEGQRQFAISVIRAVIMLAPCCLIAWWAFGAVARDFFFVISVFLGFYFGSR